MGIIFEMFWEIIKYLIQNLLTIFFGIVGIIFAVAIYLRQKQQNLQQQEQIDQIQSLSSDISEKILGTLPDFDSVYERIAEIIEVANEDKNSKVYLMIYWTWFGSDKEIRDGKFEHLNSQTSKVNQKIKARLSEGLETHLVIYKTGKNLKDFVKTVLEYRKVKSDSEKYEENLQKLIEEYELDIQGMNNTIKKNSKQEIVEQASIPLLLCVSERSDKREAVLFLGEKEELDKGIKTGGLYSQESTAVDMFLNHIKRHLKISENPSNEKENPKQLTPTSAQTEIQVKSINNPTKTSKSRK